MKPDIPWGHMLVNAPNHYHQEYVGLKDLGHFQENVQIV